MYLWELFEDSEGSIVDNLRDSLLDMLTPLAANGVPYVLIDNVIDKLQAQRSGIAIDRALVMQVLNPDEVKMITKIEGDRIYFQQPEPNSRGVSKDTAKKEAEKNTDKAVKQATKQVTSDKGLG